MASFQRADFAALDPALVALANGDKPPIGRFWWERTKGASKDTDAAVALLWLLTFSRRPLACQVGAADRDQADEVRKILKGILRLNEWLSEVVTVQSFQIRNDRTDSVCDIIAADTAGSHGARPDFLLLNEASHITKQEYAENLLDNAAKVPGGVVLVCTNAGFQPSWQWDLRQVVTASGRWHFAAVTQPAPWLDPDELADRQRAVASVRFDRLWRGVWASEGDALSHAAIDSAIDASATPHTARRQGFAYACGIDLSLSRDFSAVVLLAKSTGYTTTTTQPARRLAGTQAALADLGMLDTPREIPEHTHHPGDQRVHLAGVKVWRPRHGKIDLAGVQDYLLHLHGAFRPTMLIDVYQAELLAQQLRRQGVAIEGVAFTPSLHNDVAAEVLSLFNDRRVTLYADDALLGDLRRAQVIDRASGVRLQWDRSADTGHGDVGVSFGLASLAMKRRRPAARVIPRAIALDDAWIEHGDASFESAAVDERAAVQEVLEWLSSR